MNFKKSLAIILSVCMIFSLAACQNGSVADSSSESSTKNVIEEASDAFLNDVTASTTCLFADSNGISSSNAAESDLSSADTTADNSDDPAAWSVAQIVDAYKNAAKKSNAAVKSAQSIELKSISVNNGEYEGLFEFITPIMSKLLANNSKEKDGITGGYNNLVASDVALAKAYKIGNNIAIEMVMKEQISGAQDDALDGSVGHAITAVGDISVVTKQLKDLGLPLEISEKDTKIYYTNPVVKVLINSKGEIVSGTWRYTVDINLNNYKAFGKAVNTTSVVMDNIITVNGGFKK